MKVWKTSVLYEKLDPDNCKYGKKQQITQIDIWSENIDSNHFLPVYKGDLERLPTDSNPVFVSETEKEAYQRALEHCRLVEDEPNLMYEFIPMDTRTAIHTYCYTHFPEILI